MTAWRAPKVARLLKIICGLLDKGGVFKIDVQKQLLIKELRKYLDRAEKDDTTYCELLMEIPELLETFNCGLN